jgi:hypothetical protein
MVVSVVLRIIFYIYTMRAGGININTNTIWLRFESFGIKSRGIGYSSICRGWQVKGDSEDV